jgi:DNA-binding NarL/FixJ family response regulator
MATRVYLVDDHPLVREWLVNLLRIEPDLSVVGEAGEAATAMTAMLADPPHVAVVDLSLHRGSGLDLIKTLREQLPNVGVIVLSMHEELTDIERAFRAGALGYVTKRESTRLIVEAIRSVRAGKVFANPTTLAQLAARFVGRTPSPETIEGLSDRELDVFRRLGSGQSTREIAETLGVSLKTVQTYCARIKEKLGLQDWQELSRYAYLRNARQSGIDRLSGGA